MQRRISKKCTYGGKEKRIAFATIKEILSIKSDGGDVIPNIDISLIESFSRASGSAMLIIGLGEKSVII